MLLVPFASMFLRSYNPKLSSATPPRPAPAPPAPASPAAAAAGSRGRGVAPLLAPRVSLLGSFGAENAGTPRKLKIRKAGEFRVPLRRATDTRPLHLFVDAASSSSAVVVVAVVGPPHNCSPRLPRLAVFGCVCVDGAPPSNRAELRPPLIDWLLPPPPLDRNVCARVHPLIERRVSSHTPRATTLNRIDTIPYDPTHPRSNPVFIDSTPNPTQAPPPPTHNTAQTQTQTMRKYLSIAAAALLAASCQARTVMIGDS